MLKEELIFGLHTVAALLKEAPYQVLQLYTQKGREDQYLEKIITIAREQKSSYHTLSREKLDQMVPDSPH